MGSLTLKACTRCGEVKLLEDYHRRTAARDGRQPHCKVCAIEYMRDYYATRAERKREADRAWHSAHPEYSRERHEASRDRRRAYMRDYHAANRDRVRANGWATKYRARARKYGHEPVIERFTVAELIARWGDACWHCKVGPFEHLDHYPVAVADGGAHTLESCRPSCRPCNLAGGARARARRQAQAV